MANDLANYDLIYIKPSNSDIKDIKELIKKQGETTCKNLISIQTISEKVSGFTFGYTCSLKKAQIGRRSIKNVNDHFILKSFILCNHNPNAPDQITIELICSINKTGKLLMELVEEKARNMNIKRIYLYSLAILPLKKWYESLGYTCFTTIFISENIPKVYSMVKYI